MYMGKLTASDIGRAFGKVGKVADKLSSSAKDIKGAVADSVAKQVAPKVAGTAAIAAVVGSAVMLALVTVMQRKRRH